MSRRVDIAAAAAVLGLSQAATKKRLQRGSLAGGKDETGRWYADLDDQHLDMEAFHTEENGHRNGDNYPHNGRGDGRGDTGIPPASQRDDTLVQALQGEVLYLRAELTAMREQRDEERRRHDTIIAQLTSRPRALAPVTDTLSDSDSVSTSAETDSIETDSATAQASPRRWWRRLLGR